MTEGGRPRWGAKSLACGGGGGAEWEEGCWANEAGPTEGPCPNIRRC